MCIAFKKKKKQKIKAAFSNVMRMRNAIAPMEIGFNQFFEEAECIKEQPNWIYRNNGE